jgi:ParB family chromosome partitioning protein
MSKEQPKPRLGRGLASLLGAVAETGGVRDLSISPAETVSGSVSPEVSSSRDSGVREEPARSVAVHRVEPNPYQPRLQIDPQALAEMVESIRRHGIVQPIVVRPKGENFELVVGQRRLEAARQLELLEVPAIIRDATDQQVLEIALVENIHREDLNSVDRALAYRNYQDSFSLSAEAIAERLGQDRTTVTNYLRLLTLPAPVLDLLRGNQLSMGHARAIAGLENAEDQTKLAGKVAQLGLSVRQTEAMVARLKAGTPAPSKSNDAPKTPNVLDLEQQMMRSLSTKVQIKPSRKKGSGKVVIEYYSLDDFDRILDRVCGAEREEF